MLYLQKVFYWALKKCGLHFEVPHDIAAKDFSNCPLQEIQIHMTNAFLNS